MKFCHKDGTIDTVAKNIEAPVADYEWLSDLSTAPNDMFGWNVFPFVENGSDDVAGVDYYFGDAETPIASVEKGSVTFDALVKKSKLGKRRRDA